VPVIHQRVKWALVLALAALLGACEKEEPLPNNAAAPEADASFECPVPESLRGKVSSVFVEATRIGEPGGKGELALEGSFVAYAVGLTLQNGSNVSIQLDDTLGFSAKGLAHHTACEQFKWKSLGNLTLFEYLHGGANPYPAQQLMYSRGPTPNFRNLYAHFGKDPAAFYESQGERCLAGLVKGDGEVQRWCYQDGKLHLTRKMLQASFAGGDYRFVCDFSGEGPLLVDASIVKAGPDRSPPGLESDQLATDFREKCLTEKALLKARALDEN